MLWEKEKVAIWVWTSAIPYLMVREHDILMKIWRMSRERVFQTEGKANTNPLVEVVWGWGPCRY